MACLATASRVGRPGIAVVWESPDIPGLGMAPVREPADPVVVRLVLGPRSEWFTAGAVRALATVRWVVGADSNRTAVRLEGPALPRARDGEPASEPLIVGAVQVPRDGRPVLFLADHPGDWRIPGDRVCVPGGLGRRGAGAAGDGDPVPNGRRLGLAVTTSGGARRCPGLTTRRVQVRPEGGPRQRRLCARQEAGAGARTGTGARVLAGT